MNKKVLWGLGIGLLGALLVKDGIKKDNPKDKKKVSNTKKYMVGRSEKSNYQLVVDEGIEKEYRSIEFVPFSGKNPLGLGTVYMNEEDARDFYPLKEKLNKNKRWVIYGKHDPLP